MDFEVVDYLPFPLERVYPTMRDKLPDLVPYLPDIKSITVVEREDLGEGRLRLVSQWMAENRIPRASRRPDQTRAVGLAGTCRMGRATHSVRTIWRCCSSRSTSTSMANRLLVDSRRRVPGAADGDAAPRSGQAPGRAAPAGQSDAVGRRTVRAAR